MATVMEGPLSKWTNVMKGWQYRWFVLDENAGLLSYYTSKEKMMRGARRGCVRLKGAVIGIDDEDDSTFTLTVDHKTFHFQAQNAEEKEKWIDALETTILRHSRVSKVSGPSAPSFSDFEKKLAEADAYLQILIDQVKGLEARLERCEDEAARERYTAIKHTAEAMIESIKQSIVLLQITKANTEAVQVGEDAISVGGGAGPDLASYNTQATTGTTASCPLSITTSGSASQLSSTSPAPGSVPGGVTSVPALSYSSSEDECFYDAAETSTEQHRVNGLRRRSNDASGHQHDNATAQHHGNNNNSGASHAGHNAQLASPWKQRAAALATGQSAPNNEPSNEPSTPPPVIVSENDVYDELYDDNEEDELESLDAHGSIITHLLSQVRIGMDLTKIVLPTFILEKRSLLEMFADFLAHPELFSSITDPTSPRSRFVSCVRWYLSAFHAGRRSAVAKKPYNPILGETFQCHYELPQEPACRERASDGPVPWAADNNVTILAEQVSHHPPISAFYAENKSKRVCIDGYIWTKSKFLGLSIGVHMIGQAVLTLLDHNEEYIITFPNAYGRSILTVPWVELGGKVGVQCVKTGYHANIEFHTKPFYGGKKDQITAEMFAPGDKKPFSTVKGEWNGMMWAKHTTGESELFLDTKAMPVCKKLVRPLDQQGESESRRLWRDVTRSLKDKDVTKATEYKRGLEQRQREEAKARKEAGAAWVTKHFHEVGEHWVYDRSLVKRLLALTAPLAPTPRTPST